MFNLEIEDTYEIDKVNVPNVVNYIISNRKNITISNDSYILSKPKKKVELNFLSSGDFIVKDKPEGTRERIKFRFKENKIKIKYSPKTFINGEKYQDDIDLGQDWDRSYDYIKSFKNIDSIMLKYSYKYKCFNSINNNLLNISIDCCYAIDPNNNNNVSEPFFYLELENVKGNLLFDFKKSNFFKELKSYLNYTTFNCNNKIYRCKDIYKGSCKVINSASDLKKYVDFVKTKYFSNKSYDYLSDYQNKFVKGNNEKERGDRVEIELKFSGYNSYEEIINIVKSKILDSWSVIKVPPRIIEDIYFDTDDLELYKSKSHFRIRKQKQNSGWISCFKSIIYEDSDCLERRKIKTKLENNEIIQLLNNKCDGNSIEEFNKFFKDKSINNLNIKPKVLINEYRDRFVVRTHQIVNYDENDQDLSLSSEVINIIFDRVYFYDISNLDFAHLLKYREIDFKSENIKYGSFISAEIEPNFRIDVKEEIEKIFNEICYEISDKYIITKEDKYQLSLKNLIPNN